MKSIKDITKSNGLTMNNRIVFSSVGQLSPDGNPTQLMYEKFGTLAKNNIGVILTGATIIDPKEDHSPVTKISDDKYIEGNKKFVDMIHENNTPVIMQMISAGSNAVNKPDDVTVLGPSEVAHAMTSIVPREATVEEIKHIVECFGKAVVRAKEAGYDGIQIHAAHGFLLSQFLSPHYNKRNDEYGGSVENRARIVVEVVKEMRKTVGDNYPIWIKLDSSEAYEDGIKEEDFETTVRILSEYKVDAIEVSGNIIAPKSKTSYFKDAAQAITKYNIQVILTGGNRDFAEMEEILNTTDIQYFGVCRPLIAEPDLITRHMNGEEVSPKCVSCNGCFNFDDYMNCILK